jgi:hypothetical protein
MDPNQELAKKLISNGHNLVLTGQGGAFARKLEFFHLNETMSV